MQKNHTITYLDQAFLRKILKEKLSNMQSQNSLIDKKLLKI